MSKKLTILLIMFSIAFFTGCGGISIDGDKIKDTLDDYLSGETGKWDSAKWDSSKWGQ